MAFSDDSTKPSVVDHMDAFEAAYNNGYNAGYAAGYATGFGDSCAELKKQKEQVET